MSPALRETSFLDAKKQPNRLRQKNISPHPLRRRMGGSFIDWTVHWTVPLFLSFRSDFLSGDSSHKFANP